jgi:hypothetical protein
MLKDKQRREIGNLLNWSVSSTPDIRTAERCVEEKNRRCGSSTWIQMTGEHVEWPPGQIPLLDDGLSRLFKSIGIV